MNEYHATVTRTLVDTYVIEAKTRTEAMMKLGARLADDRLFHPDHTFESGRKFTRIDKITRPDPDEASEPLDLDEYDRQIAAAERSG